MQSGLNFTVQAAPFKNTQKEASIALAIEIDGDRLQYRRQTRRACAANKIELSFYGVNELGKALAGTRTELDLTLKPETRERVKTFGVRVNPRISLPPGRYHLRIGAREAVGGLTGSVFYDLEVPDFRKEKLMLGGLVVASAAGQHTPSIQPDTVLAKVMPAAGHEPARVPARDLLALYTEIYDNIGSQQARNVDVAVRLLSENGAEVFATRDELTNGGAPPKKPWDIYGYSKQIALKDIRPGPLRASCRSAGSWERGRRKTICQGDADYSRSVNHFDFRRRNARCEAGPSSSPYCCSSRHRP